MDHSIGIDFGTTKTMVSYLNPATGKAELVRLGRDRDSIPTTVHMDEAGAFLFGEDADDQIEADPEGYCRAFKLHLGESDSIMPRVRATAEELTRRFLRHVKEECEQNVFHGEPIDTATITVPVSFSPARMASLKQAAETAGFSKVSFLPEPEAAGTAFLRDNPADTFSRALVLDWGGGTLDIAIISRDDDGSIHADSHCVEGRDDVGGEEMDRRLLAAGDEYWRQTFGTSLIETEENEPKLLREAEKVKVGLSRKEAVTFRRGTKKVDVSREQFQQLIGEMLNSAVELVKSALSENEKQGNPAPDAILLIGGASQMPAVRNTMEANFPNLRVLSWHHSHEAVALGATLLPAIDDFCIVNDCENATIATKFQAKYDWLKRERVPTLEGAIEPGIYQTPDGGWQCNYDGAWGYGCAITFRPGDAEPHEVHGEICKRWYREGGAFDETGRRGWLGYPISDEEVYKGDGDPADRISHFENGDIVWSEKKKETRIINIQDQAKRNDFKFQAKYDWLKRERVPTLEEAIEPGIYQTPDGGWQCNYDGAWGYGCAITLRPGDAEPHEVHGAICKRWYQEGGAFDETGRRGWLGYPTSDEEAYEGDGDSVDRISHFENGDIIWRAKEDQTIVINMLTAEALRLFAKFSMVDGAINQAEVNFMEKWYPGSTPKFTWRNMMLDNDTIESLADNTAKSYNGNEHALSALMRILYEFAICDRPINSSENAALSWIRYFFKKNQKD